VKEQWKDVVGLEGIYEVSSLGRVRRKHPRKVCGFCGGKIKRSVFKPRLNLRGYFAVYIGKNNKERTNWTIHRMVAQAFVPNPDNKPIVNHRDGRKRNNRASNLEWMTNGENVRHGWQLKKRQPLR
jgi:hypothetical protein